MPYDACSRHRALPLWEQVITSNFLKPNQDSTPRCFPMNREEEVCIVESRTSPQTLWWPSGQDSHRWWLRAGRPVTHSHRKPTKETRHSPQLVPPSRGDEAQIPLEGSIPFPASWGEKLSSWKRLMQGGRPSTARSWWHLSRPGNTLRRVARHCNTPQPSPGLNLSLENPETPLCTEGTVPRRAWKQVTHCHQLTQHRWGCCCSPSLTGPQDLE